MNVTYSALFSSVGFLWVASEVALAVLRRSGASASRRDAGSLAVINIAIYAALPIGISLGVRGHGHVALAEAAGWVGVAMILLGLVLRWWAILTLRQFFTVDVAIQQDHRVVEAGPYRLLRHPAYAGCLLSFLGLTVCVASWLSAVIILVPTTAAFLWRIAVEERALREAFPVQYPEYASRTWRLLPLVY